MQAKIQKWGNSQGLRLSRQVLALADLEIGEEVEIHVGDREILIRKTRSRRFDLEELVGRIPEGDRIGEIPMSPRVGREEW